MWELSYKFGSLIHFPHHHIQDEAVYNQNMLWRHFALSLLLTFRVLARPYLMTLYIIFPTHVNSPITSRHVSKANIHRKKQLIVSHYRRKFFSKRGFYDITHACCIWLIFPFKATASWKFSHCYLLHYFFDALYDNYQLLFWKFFFQLRENRGVNNGFKPLILSVFTTAASRIKSEQKKRKNRSWN